MAIAVAVDISKHSCVRTERIFEKVQNVRTEASAKFVGFEFAGQLAVEAEWRRTHYSIYAVSPASNSDLVGSMGNNRTLHECEASILALIGQIGYV